MDVFPTRVRMLILERRPEWEPYAAEDHEVDELCLRITIPGGHGGPDHALVIGTYHREVIVDFSVDRDYFGPYDNIPDTLVEAVDRAIEFVDSIMAERTVCITSRIRLLGLRAIGHCSPDDTRDSWYARTLKVRSWNGTHDRG